MFLSPESPPPSFSLLSLLLPVPAEILQANDNLTQVINLYKQLVRGEEVNGDAAAGSLPGERVAGGPGGAWQLERHRAQRGSAGSRAGGWDCRGDPAPLRWGRPLGRELGGVCAQAAAVGGRKSGHGAEGAGSQVLARTGRRWKTFFSFDKSGTCCAGLDGALQA